MIATNLVCLLMDSIESIITSFCNSVEIINIIRFIIAPAPRQQHELTVGVDVVIELDGVL